MKANDAPKDALRISFEVWTSAPYSAREKVELQESIRTLINEFDEDVVKGSDVVRFENAEQVTERMKREIAEALNEATIGLSLAISFVGELSGMEYEANAQVEDE